MQLNKKEKKLNINGEKLKIAIILPYFNEEIGLELLKNCKNELIKSKVKDKNIDLYRTEGALETPFACEKISKKKKYNAIITLGAIIRGETSHYDLVTKLSYEGLMNVQFLINVPIIFGILTCENQSQAKKRSSGKALNKGKSFARAALIQAAL